MYQLQIETDTTRIYRSSITGTEVSTHLIYTDGAGNRWFAFEDLVNIPFIRKKASEQITRLYGTGLTKEDITKIIGTLKNHLKSNDPEKYEKAYAELLQFEAISEQTADPNKQSLSLCTVYILSENEQIDIWSQKEAVNKMNVWALDTNAQSFFLSFLHDVMASYTQSYTELSQIASAIK